VAPLVVGYAIYSLTHNAHKVKPPLLLVWSALPHVRRLCRFSCDAVACFTPPHPPNPNHAPAAFGEQSFYSWALGSLVGFVYAFGFVAMTPQLYINYKLKRFVTFEPHA
jgi:hypothetical protein